MNGENNGGLGYYAKYRKCFSRCDRISEKLKIRHNEAPQEFSRLIATVFYKTSINERGLLFSEECRRRVGSWRSPAPWWVTGLELGAAEGGSPFRWCLLVEQAEGKNRNAAAVQVCACLFVKTWTGFCLLQSPQRSHLHACPENVRSWRQVPGSGLQESGSVPGTSGWIGVCKLFCSYGYSALV